MEETPADRKEAFRRRTKGYASAIIRFYCQLPKTRPEVQVLGRQMLRSGTSVAANYREASRARSDADFISKIETCAQEADETSLWLELLHEDCGGRRAPGLASERNRPTYFYLRHDGQECKTQTKREQIMTRQGFRVLSGFIPL